MEKAMKRKLLCVALLCATTGFAVAAENPWVGTWKLDPAKSHFTGDTFTYSKTPKGMMHYSDGSTTSYDFGIDGKEYKTPYDRTVVWNAAGPGAWDSTTSMNGKVLSKNHRVLSDNDKTMTMTITGTKPDGTPFNDSAVYTRVTGTKGLEGKWRSTKVDVSAPDSYIIRQPSPGVYRWDIPGYKAYVEGKADGSDSPAKGPTVPPGLTLAFKQVSPMKMTYTEKFNGKPDAMATQTMAADKKLFTEVSWAPGKESEKSTAVYVKQ
jgi:hypothetical protein